MSAARDLVGNSADAAELEAELDWLADRIRTRLHRPFSGAHVVKAFRNVVFDEERFVYDGNAGDPENFLLGAVLARKRGNCLGLSMLYLSLAERLSVPFRGVNLPSHCFVRYEGPDGSLNVEFASGGAAWGEERYRREFRIGNGRPYLASLGGGEMLGLFLKSLGAAWSRIGREEDALRFYGEAIRLFPGLPEAHYNAGISLLRLGRTEEAIGGFRAALSLDPELAVARDNLGIGLAKQGRFGEAIAEGRRAVALEPGNAAMRRNLAATYCASGDIRAGEGEYRRALEIDPGNPRAMAGLERIRGLGEGRRLR